MSEQDFHSLITELLGATASKDQPQTVEAAYELQNLCSAAVQRMSIIHAGIRFDSSSASLTHFKKTLPHLFGLHIYAQQTLEILLFKPSGPCQRINTYFEQRLIEIETARKQNAEIYRYFRLHQSDKDQQLFDPSLSKDTTKTFPWLSSFYPLPSGTLPFAQIRADELTTEWILRSMALEQLPLKNDDGPGLKWTGTQAALTELLYALNEMGILNGTRHEIQKLKIFFEKVFDINLGNIYKTYEHNRLRKKSRTPFIDGLKAALLRRMDDDDLNAL